MLFIVIYVIMVISRIYLKGRLVYLYLSTGHVFTLPKNSISELEIYEGLEVDEDDIAAIRKKAFEVSACKDASAIIKRSFLSEKNLILKLQKKGHKKRFIKYAVKYLKEYDLIDDKRFAKIAVNSLKLKGKSKKAIINYLKKCGIKNKIIEKSILKVSLKDEINMLKDAIRKCYKLYEGKYDIKNKLIKSLISKGFDYANSQRLIELYIKNKLKEK